MMNNLKLLYNNMVENRQFSNVFSVIYNKHGFSCIFIIQDYGCTLYISTLGKNTETIAIDIPDDFSVIKRLNSKEYSILADYLGFTGKTTNKFYPSVFFKEFDQNIKPSLNKAATLKEKARVIGRSANISEEDRIFFCGWRKNGSNERVSVKNYEKTKRLMGKAIADDMLNKNISSRWTNDEDKENLTRINEYLSWID